MNIKFKVPTKIGFAIGSLLTLIILFSGILASTAMDHTNDSQDCLFTSNSGNTSKDADNCINFQIGVLNELSNANMDSGALMLLLMSLIILSGGLGSTNKRLNLNLFFFRFRLYLKFLFESRTKYFLKELGNWLKLLQKQNAKPFLGMAFYIT